MLQSRQCRTAPSLIFASFYSHVVIEIDAVKIVSHHANSASKVAKGKHFRVEVSR
jgi:hypothetical protein